MFWENHNIENKINIVTWRLAIIKAKVVEKNYNNVQSLDIQIEVTSKVKKYKSIWFL